MFLSQRTYFQSFDWINFVLTCALAITGLFFVLSATHVPEQPYSIFFKKQCLGILFGLCIYLLFCFTDSRLLMRLGYFGYFIALFLLCITMVKGSIGLGAQRWINLGFAKIQPAELVKLLFPAFASYFFFTQEKKPSHLYDFAPLLSFLLVSIILILKQPDLGTAIIVGTASMILLFISGLERKWFVRLFIVSLLCAPIGWKCLKPYQKQRIAVFLGHGSEQKERYQIEQAKIAIGSGGLTGKGFLQGTQNVFQFLPESRTDFIFAVIAEEWGFAGALFILLLFVLLCLRIGHVYLSVSPLWCKLLTLGLSLHIMLCIFINIAMVTGLLPIVGIPLPLMSYGLSNLWVVMASLGWLNGIYMRRGIIRQ